MPPVWGCFGGFVSSPHITTYTGLRQEVAWRVERPAVLTRVVSDLQRFGHRSKSPAI